MSIRRIGPQALFHRIESGERFVILDVREPFERRLAVIPVHGAVKELAVPTGEIPNRFGEISSGVGDHELVVYCHHGIRSRMVVEWLATQGIDGAYNLDGGIDAWSLRVDPSIPRY